MVRTAFFLSLCLTLGCTGHVHEDVSEPEIEPEELEEQPADPDRWQNVTQEWSETKPPVEQAKESYRRGLEAYQEGNYEAALDEFRAAYDLQPLDPLRYNIAMCLERMGRFDEAIVELEALADRAEEPYLRSEAARRRDALQRKLQLREMPPPT